MMSDLGTRSLGDTGGHRGGDVPQLVGSTV